MEEIWKSITGYNGFYEVSNFGRVKSLKRWVKFKNGGGYTRNETILKPGLTSGYLSIKLSNGIIVKTFKVHRLVAFEFIDNNLNKPFINHINGIKTDNNYTNLEWCTAKENSIHCVENGLRKYNLKMYSIKDILIDLNNGLSIRKTAAKHNISKSIIFNISHGIYPKSYKGEL